MSRFIDGEFNTKALSPICGYWNEKLVTLEQALKPIAPLLEQLDRSIQAAKKYCHMPSEHGLTHDESAALYLYSMEGGDNSFYRVLNQALRSEDRPALKIWFPFLKLFDTALSKLPTVRRNVWRGVVGDIGRDLKKKEELTWWNISSCSLSVDIIKDFLSTETQSTMFLIEAAHGKDISCYSNYANEDEILLAPGTQLRVIAIAMDLPGRFNVVHLTEVSDEPLPPTVPTKSVLSRATEQDECRMYQENSSIKGAEQPKKTALFVKRLQPIPERSRRSTLACGGRRCVICGRCRDWKLVEGGSRMSYSDWRRVTDPDASCRYSHLQHALNMLSWNCSCNP